MPRRHPRDPGPSEALGERVGEARRAAGFTQKELASALGISERAVQAWEEGQASPFRHLDRLAAAVRRSPDWILHGDVRDVLSGRPFEELLTDFEERALLTEDHLLADQLVVKQPRPRVAQRLERLEEWMEVLDATVKTLVERVDRMTDAAR